MCVVRRARPHAESAADLVTEVFDFRAPGTIHVLGCRNGKGYALVPLGGRQIHHHGGGEHRSHQQRSLQFEKKRQPLPELVHVPYLASISLRHWRCATANRRRILMGPRHIMKKKWITFLMRTVRGLKGLFKSAGANRERLE